MKIKLISPAVTMRPMDSRWKTQMAPPLGLGVLAALAPERHQVEIQDENVEKLRLNDHPDLVGITVKVDTVDRTREIALAYRRKNIPVILGGIHATACPEECVRFANAVVVGEAEEIWPQLLSDVERGQLKKIYRNCGSVEIKTVPIPKWECFKRSKYLFTNTLTIGRGCPWRCDFCYNSSKNIDARYRMKSIRQIIAEIESLNVDHVMFIDDNFIGDLEGVRMLLPEFKRMGITWHTAVSANIGKHTDILDAMADSGCKSLFIGFETVNQKNLQCCHKTQNRIERYDSVIEDIHERGMMVNASVVFGFDGDDASVFPTTLDWLVRNRVASMTGHILTPYPGTRLYSQLEKEGRIIDRDLTHYNTAHAVFSPLNMTADELEKGYLDIYSRFYSWENILKRWPVNRAQVTGYLQFNLLYRKYGKQLSLMGNIVGMRRLAEFSRRLAYPAWKSRRKGLEGAERRSSLRGVFASGRV